MFFNVDNVKILIGLFLTGHEVKPDDLHTCHCLKKKETAIVIFKCREHKRRVLDDRENLRNNVEDLRQLSSSYQRACAMKTITVIN